MEIRLLDVFVVANTAVGYRDLEMSEVAVCSVMMRTGHLCGSQYQ